METCGRGSSEREQRIVGSMEDLGIERGIGGRKTKGIDEASMAKMMFDIGQC